MKDYDKAFYRFVICSVLAFAGIVAILTHLDTSLKDRHAILTGETK